MIASTAQAAGQKMACKQSCSTPLAPARRSAVRAAARAHTGLDSKVRQVVGGLATRLRQQAIDYASLVIKLCMIATLDRVCSCACTSSLCCSMLRVCCCCCSSRHADWQLAFQGWSSRACTATPKGVCRHLIAAAVCQVYAAVVLACAGPVSNTTPHSHLTHCLLSCLHLSSVQACLAVPTLSSQGRVLLRPAAAVAEKMSGAASQFSQPAGKGLGFYTGEDGYMYCDNMRVDDIRHQVCGRPQCILQGAELVPGADGASWPKLCTAAGS